MMFNAGFPIIEYLLFLSNRVFAKVKDKGMNDFCLKKKVTRSVSIQSYLERNTGPSFPIHFKYSLMLNVVFVTFMYGAAIPILFVVAMASFAVFYCLERIILAYSSAKQPTFEDQINDSTLDFMMWAPLLFLGNGFW